MSYLVLSCSLNPQSRSRVLAQRAAELLRDVSREHGDDVDFIDLRECALPICDANECYAHPAVQDLAQKIRAASGILLATPVYNYAASASAKNLIELTGSAWNNRLVGFLCAAGGRSSYMAVMALANSLMLDFRAVILPRFVYTDESDFTDYAFANPGIEDRLRDLATTLITLANALNINQD